MRSASGSQRATRPGHLLAGARHGRAEVDPVGRTTASGVRLEPASGPLEQPVGADGVSASSVREPDAELGQALPQVALVVGPGLPARLEHLVRRERPPLAHQATAVSMVSQAAAPPPAPVRPRHGRTHLRRSRRAFFGTAVFYQIRHALNGGDPLANASGHIEQGLFALMSLGFAYVLMRLDLGRANPVFRFASLAFGVLSAVFIVFGLGIVENPLLNSEPIPGVPVFSSLLLAYLVPGLAAVLLARASRGCGPAGT